MSVGEQVWDHIRAGRPPAPSTVAAVGRAARVVLGADGEASVTAALAATVLGAGPLEEVLQESGVTDVVVNGDGGVWVDRGCGMRRVDLDLGSIADRRALAVRLAGIAGRRLDDATAYVDAVLPSGVRLHAILPPLVTGGPHLTFRVPSRIPPSFAALQAMGMFPAGWGPVLAALVDRKVSYVVTGGTGAGKTTLLGAMLGLVPPAERLVIVEDVRELAVGHPHVVHLEGRPPNVEGVGEVTMVTLVRQALRMRPDRLVVGEVRGAEVRELLAALNTGHEGGCGTIHANAVGDVVARFEALGALGGMTRQAVHAQLLSAVRVVIHVRRGADGRRRVDSVGVLQADADGVARVTTALGPGGEAARPRVPVQDGAAALSQLTRIEAGRWS